MRPKHAQAATKVISGALWTPWGHGELEDASQCWCLFTGLGIFRALAFSADVSNSHTMVLKIGSLRW